MPHIEQLSPHIADLIAAGEVVERPASVVKELLENALDAGAENVTVEIRDGGMTYLRVSDDGCGIEPGELPTAFLRHATSKLRRAEDLSAIGTLGFRGEALAAISSVSRVDIFSRTRGAQSGATLHLEGGVPGSVEDAGCPEGTSVIVRDLFFNTPARLKFMKRDSAEAAAVSGVVTHLALSHPEVSFRLLRDNAETLHTPGDGALKSAVYAALGREFALSLLEVRARDGALAAEGFATKPLNGRGSRGMQIFFINNRLVKSQLLTAALEGAYANRIMKGKFPGCVLNVTLPCDLVDVNVHPAKTVVKFLNEKQVFDLVYHGVSDALSREGMAAPEPDRPTLTQKPRADFYQTMSAAQFRERVSGTAQPSKRAPEEPAAARKGAAIDAAERATASVFKTRIPPVQLGELGGRTGVSDYVRRPSVTMPPASPASVKVEPARSEHAGVADTSSLPSVAPTAAPPEPPSTMAEAEQTTLLPEQTRPWRIAGEVLDTYIVCEDGAGSVFLIDKHAAHERVNFDRFKANVGPILSQTLLAPLVAQLSGETYAALAGETALLRAYGFECEEFGGNALLVRAIPADIDEGDAISTLEEIADKLSHGAADPAAARDALLATLACKAAIKGGWKSDVSELRALVDKVQSGEIEYCPHGRPVKVELTQRAIEKMFKRIV